MVRVAITVKLVNIELLREQLHLYVISEIMVVWIMRMAPATRYMCSARIAPSGMKLKFLKELLSQRPHVLNVEI